MINIRRWRLYPQQVVHTGASKYTHKDSLNRCWYEYIQVLVHTGDITLYTSANRPHTGTGTHRCYMFTITVEGGPRK
jgi:hypothetical protein